MIFDRNNDDGYEGISVEEFASVDLKFAKGNPSTDYDIDVQYYKVLNIHVAKVASETITAN